MSVAPTADYVQVRLTRDDESKSFGLRLRRRAGGLVVRQVDEEGSMARWNFENPQQEVQAGDRVVSVDGAIGGDAMLVWDVIDLYHSEVTLLIARSPDKGIQDPAPFLNGLETDLEQRVGSDECPICLQAMEGDEEVVLLPCRHALHRECAAAWLQKCRNLRCARCPTCRSVPVDAGGQIKETTSLSSSSTESSVVEV